VKPSRRRRAIIVKCDILHFTATVFRHLVQQEFVYRTADAETKHARLRMLLHFRNNFHLVADIAIGHEADDAHVVLRICPFE
jgi:hypothetical protein